MTLNTGSDTDDPSLGFKLSELDTKLIQVLDQSSTCTQGEGSQRTTAGSRFLFVDTHREKDDTDGSKAPMNTPLLSPRPRSVHGDEK